MGIFEKIKKGLLKTKNSMLGKIKHVINSFTKIDEELFEQLEETMIMSDIGVETSVLICNELRKKIKERGITDPSLIMQLLQEIISDIMGDDTGLNLETTPSVILVIGVNGVGKTTTIGKLCYQLRNEGKKVIVAAADTFRAAAIDQLEIWTERAGVEIVKHSEGSDPASVVFDAVSAAKARNCDVVVCDTAGRLHNKKNLMDELAKINRVIEKQAEGCSKEVLLVLDATTGQNAVNQAKTFKEVADITGIVLTKLDGTAKGGIVISIKHELDIPVKLIGLGEKLDDLQPFNSDDFVKALFDDDTEDKIKESDYERLEGNEDAEYIADEEETEAEDIIENVYDEPQQTIKEENTEEVPEIAEENSVAEETETEENQTAWNASFDTESYMSWNSVNNDNSADTAEENIIIETDENTSETFDTYEETEHIVEEFNDDITVSDDEITDSTENSDNDDDENEETDTEEKTKKKFSFGNLFKRNKKDKKKK